MWLPAQLRMCKRSEVEYCVYDIFDNIASTLSCNAPPPAAQHICPKTAARCATEYQDPAIAEPMLNYLILFGTKADTTQS
ncbi:hypothetical protein SNOG_09559 [Parastagonospora nodorum SN15]|uniref:Uncharacterized protein n=1 Tax=Phaeosphaeria nodorum (strain SN15 / ATCC MYA-4574 / FGSC 10173) TaxID=321614 RepID=Q0UFA5_PHANO|nr:hypothetical protein SNOG_09559 [Parastagonospora nodorum SN15]EAT82824.1 hypothetical protein SNOG_09559 [Parastagonospora nodorum SN15]